MLILSRKSGESIVIDGRIKVTVMRVDGDVVKIGIEAPVEVPVHRQEVFDEIQRGNPQESTPSHLTFPKVLGPRNENRKASLGGFPEDKS
jgi:carbon storage regulator